jgi:hypothetical protein
MLTYLNPTATAAGYIISTLFNINRKVSIEHQGWGLGLGRCSWGGFSGCHEDCTLSTRISFLSSLPLMWVVGRSSLGLAGSSKRNTLSLRVFRMNTLGGFSYVSVSIRAFSLKKDGLSFFMSACSFTSFARLDSWQASVLLSYFLVE